MSTVIEASTVSEVISAVQKLSPPAGGLYTYRGTRDRSWASEPGIARKGRENFLRNEKFAVRELISVHPQEFYHDDTMFDRLVRMQHYRLPSRLLDVTANPLVALYFATEEVDPAMGPATDGRVACTAIPPERIKYYDSDTVSCITNLCNMSSDEKKEEIYASRNLNRNAFNALPVVDRFYSSFAMRNRTSEMKLILKS